MVQRTAVVGSSVGLHARPAALFVQAAARQPVKVRIAKPGGEAVDARSILSVLGLDARNGEEVVLTADGDDDGGQAALAAQAAVDELAALLERDLDAEP